MEKGNVHTLTPFSLFKNLGRAYNEAMRMLAPDDWAILKDQDVLLLTPDTIRHIHEYTQRFPEAGLMTCWTNRISNVEQLYRGKISHDPNIRTHLVIAKHQEEKLYQVTELVKPISGFIMVLKKSTWDRIKFTENLKCLGVDNDYHKRIRAIGMPVLRMDGIYVFHTYRMLTRTRDKTHLI